MNNQKLFILNDNDPQYACETKDKAGHYVEVYCNQTDATEQLLLSTAQQKKLGDDFIQQFALEHDIIDDYNLNFYAEYYPYTKEVALKPSFNVFNGNVAAIMEDFSQMCDNVKDGYVQLSKEQKETLRNELENYLDLDEFYHIEKEADNVR